MFSTSPISTRTQENEQNTKSFGAYRLAYQPPFSPCGNPCRGLIARDEAELGTKYKVLFHSGRSLWLNADN